MLPTSRLRRPLVALAFLGVAVPLQVRRCHGARRSADHVVQRGCVDDEWHWVLSTASTTM